MNIDKLVDSISDVDLKSFVSYLYKDKVLEIVDEHELESTFVLANKILPFIENWEDIDADMYLTTILIIYFGSIFKADVYQIFDNSYIENSLVKTTILRSILLVRNSFTGAGINVYGFPADSVEYQVYNLFMLRRILKESYEI